MARSRSCANRVNGCSQRLLSILFAGFVAIALPLRAQVIEYSPTLSSVAAPLPADDTATGNRLITGQVGANTAPFEYAIHPSIRGAYDANITVAPIQCTDH